MLFKDILGHEHLKNHLIQSASNKRNAHSQLFIGPEGSGALPLAVAYARQIICNDNENTQAPCHVKFNNLTHPDLHFVFPVAKTSKVKTHPVSKMFLEEWRTMLKKQPYGNLFDWYSALGMDNKQGQIGVDEAKDISKSLSLKSYEGGYKVMIIWMVERMNIACANKLLKLLEEPPKNTVFILIAEDEEQIISTIKSRCQVLRIPPLSENVIKNSLIQNFQLPQNEASKIAHQANGNYNKACDLMYQDSEDTQFEEWFVLWVRSAFKAKGNKAAIHDLISWSDIIAKTGRETQKKFLSFCLDLFRQALLLNYQAHDLVYMEPQSKSFKLEKFAPFIHHNNIEDISTETQEAIYHIERNGNSKIIFTDLSIKLTRLLHKKTE